ncbi:Helix-turn-helix [Seinonella peptonophila]|uniref:Helix-turn-helix n=1 Tax=Seinonella peptonophila TaxID=112248 RepID=A0A1M4VCV7_9BACL|nr:helix-turn-helix transcriptional regulator [Seinonella peptonophila]SHE66753.1 Helix-turn-helix [Seinonella peptonophila]
MVQAIRDSGAALKRAKLDLEEDLGREVPLKIFAQLLGVTTSSVSAYFKGKATPPIDKAFLLCKFLNKSMHELFPMHIKFDSQELDFLDDLRNNDNSEVIELIKSRLTTSV